MPDGTRALLIMRKDHENYEATFAYLACRYSEVLQVDDLKAAWKADITSFTLLCWAGSCATPAHASKTHWFDRYVRADEAAKSSPPRRVPRGRGKKVFVPAGAR